MRCTLRKLSLNYEKALLCHILYIYGRKLLHFLICVGAEMSTPKMSTHMGVDILGVDISAQPV